MSYSVNSFLYRKTLPLTVSVEQTDYQIMLTINRSTGSDSGFTVYVGDKCASDYSDIAFTDDHGNSCPYWIESSSLSTANVWVKLPVIHTSGTSLYLYYGGKVPMVSMSNGDLTFPLFDHFEGTSINTSKWTWAGGGGVITNSYINLQGSASTTSQITSTLTFGTGYVTRFYYKTAQVKAANVCDIIGAISGANRCWWKPSNYNTTEMNIENFNGTAAYTNLAGTCGIVANTWYTIDLIRKSDRATWLKNGTQIGEISTYYPTGSLSVNAYTYNSNASLFLDYVFVRKYASSEPAAGTWASVENIPSVTNTPISRFRVLKHQRRV